MSKEQLRQDDLDKRARIRNKEKLIDDLMFGEEDADKILEQHREEMMRQETNKIVYTAPGQSKIWDLHDHFPDCL